MAVLLQYILHHWQLIPCQCKSARVQALTLVLPIMVAWRRDHCERELEGIDERGRGIGDGHGSHTRVDSSARLGIP